jgi:TIR domain
VCAPEAGCLDTTDACAKMRRRALHADRGKGDMAFLRPYFEYDAFVSYSHGLPEGEREFPLRDWTLKLIRRLETDIRLVDTEFDALQIWRDEHIDPTIQLTDELRAKVSQSGILLIVMSPRYLTSSWCKDELDWFKQQVEDRMRDQGRVFVIRAMNTDETKWPDFLRDSRGHALPGFQFHDRQFSPLPYDWRSAGMNRDAYVQVLGRLQTALMLRLRDLRANAERRVTIEAPVAVAPAAGPRRIYLHARPEHAAVCDEIKRLLSQDGIPALSPIADPGRDIADSFKDAQVKLANDFYFVCFRSHPICSMRRHRN